MFPPKHSLQFRQSKRKLGTPNNASFEPEFEKANKEKTKQKQISYIFVKDEVFRSYRELGCRFTSEHATYGTAFVEAFQRYTTVARYH